MQYEYILMAIPIILVVAFIVVIAKRITDGSGAGLDMKEAVLGSTLVVVGLLIMVPLIESTDPWDYDSETKTLTISGNIKEENMSWGDAADAEKLIINDGVTAISSGAFESLESLEYLKVPNSLTNLDEATFSVDLIDNSDQAMTTVAAGEYVGLGNGALYYCDPSIFTYSTDSTFITGLASSASGAKNLVLPSERNGTTLTGIYANAFASNTDASLVISVPDCEIADVSSKAFQGCTALEAVHLDSVTGISGQVFESCTALVTIDMPSLESAGNYAFRYIGASSVSLPALETLGSGAFGGCTSLASASIPKVTALGNTVFDGCTALATIDLSKIETIGGSTFRGTALATIDLSSLQSVGTSAFASVTSVTSVTFGSGLTEVASNSFSYWTFYDTDGATEIDKTVASNLAGFRFTGTSTALVKTA